MSGETTIIYNGVTLRRVHTRIFDQQPIREESDTDIVHQQFNIAVEGLVNYGAFQNQNAGSLGLTCNQFVPLSNTPAGILALARKLLGEDRGAFSMRMSGAEILSANTTNGQPDVNNGPKVKHIRVTHVSATTFRISFAIEVALIDCKPYNQSGVVLNNRWSAVDEIDELERTTRTWSGRLRVKNVIFNPQMFRGVVIPPLQRGWKRKRMRFASDPNALELAYEIVDEELIGDAPPNPAYKMSIVHSEGMSIGGAKGAGEITVRLEGGKNSDRVALANRTLQIAFAKLQLFR